MMPVSRLVLGGTAKVGFDQVEMHALKHALFYTLEDGSPVPEER